MEGCRRKEKQTTIRFKFNTSCMMSATKNEKATLVGVTTLGWLKKVGCMRNGPPVLYSWYCGPRGVSHVNRTKPLGFLGVSHHRPIENLLGVNNRHRHACFCNRFMVSIIPAPGCASILNFVMAALIVTNFESSSLKFLFLINFCCLPLCSSRRGGK